MVTVMLSLFAVENYRGFSERVEMDLSRIRDYDFHREYIRNGLVNKCMVMGRNGCGKTDLGLALFDIVGVLNDSGTVLKEYDDPGFLNACSGVPYATFLYVFRFGSDEIRYEYRKTSPRDVIYEMMTVNGKTAFVRDGMHSDLSGLGGCGIRGLDSKVCESGTTLLRAMAESADLPPGSPVLVVIGFVRGMTYVGPTAGGFRVIGPPWNPETQQGFIVSNGLVDDFEKTLRDLADMDVDLDVIHASGSEGKLVIRSGNRAIDFDCVASSGMKSLLLHYCCLRCLNNASLLYLDGFDAYYHFDLAEKLMHRFFEDPGFQCVFTSHNTTLVRNRILRPDCYMVLDSRGITSLPDLTDREIREGHNLEKLLRGGEFDERPNPRP